MIFYHTSCKCSISHWNIRGHILLTYDLVLRFRHVENRKIQSSVFFCIFLPLKSFRCLNISQSWRTYLPAGSLRSITSCENMNIFTLLCALKQSIFESYVNKPLQLHMPPKLKHFTQLPKNTQFSSLLLSLFFFWRGRRRGLLEGGSSGNMGCGNPSHKNKGGAAAL